MERGIQKPADPLYDKAIVRLVRAWLMLAACWDSWKGQMGGPLTEHTAKNLKWEWMEQQFTSFSGVQSYVWDYRTDNQQIVVWFLTGAKNLTFSHASQLALGLFQPPIQWLPEALSGAGGGKLGRVWSRIHTHTLHSYKHTHTHSMDQFLSVSQRQQYVE